MFSAKIAAATGFLAVANCHMLLVNPKPFDFTTATNADGYGRPLDAAGSDFPCRRINEAYTGPTNSYPQGSNQTLQLQGSAVHGGGSCQISITYDTEPTKNSVFKVIHTIQGGCPARNTEGNMVGTAETPDPFTYDFTIPSDIPTGKGTIAWSWLNRIGNREYYMECGAVEITGSGGDKSNFDKLPDLFVANIASENNCNTQNGAGKDAWIPQPGDSVEVNKGTDWQFFGEFVCTSVTPGDTGSGSGGGSSATAAPTSVATSIATSVPGGVFLTKTTAAASSVIATTTAAQATSVATSPAATASAGSGSGSGSQSGQLTGACSTEGAWNCVNGSSFQQCASGQWSVVMSMAAGTTCTAGQSSELKIAAGRKMRSFKA
ncbi:uncharacterized protein JN550_005189 [Neoarthrinium moseri]|uniref:uncharacterized protein n=1 Tax=Neoarthrinium moseri TaxID=1658444 RepID=UPI001FDD9A3E|nr:uncharacterized protein JN550_005189 [Neoarthrinium moseri]KAI1870646.1 hypothetical protein JN550_005189 [Neoarthrinium moseri]